MVSLKREPSERSALEDKSAEQELRMQDFDSDAPSDNESDIKRSFISASSIPS